MAFTLNPFTGLLDYYQNIPSSGTPTNTGVLYLNEDGVTETDSQFTYVDAQYTPDSYTKLLIHFDDFPFTDSETTPKTITNTDVTRSAVQSKLGGYSGLFNGTTAFLSLADSADFEFGAGDFTVDFWFNIPNITPNYDKRYIPLQKYIDPAYRYDFQVVFSGGQFYLQMNFQAAFGGGAILYQTPLPSSLSVTSDTWHHVAFVRNGANAYIFFDGISQTLSSLNPWGAGTDLTLTGTAPILIGKDLQPNPGDFFNGYFDELRVSKGIARWTANFTPPTPKILSVPNLTFPFFETITNPVDGTIRIQGVGGAENYHIDFLLQDSATSNLQIQSNANIIEFLNSIQVSNGSQLKFGDAGNDRYGTLEMLNDGNMQISTTAGDISFADENIVTSGKIMANNANGYLAFQTASGIEVMDLVNGYATWQSASSIDCATINTTTGAWTGWADLYLSYYSTGATYWGTGGIGSALLANGGLYAVNGSQSVYLADGTYAINATGNSLFTGNITATGTLGTGVATHGGGSGNNPFTALNLNNTVTPTTTQQLQTSDIIFNLTQSVGGVASLHEAARISAYKTADWFHATTEADTDSGLRFWTTDGGTAAVRWTIDNTGSLLSGTDGTGVFAITTAGSGTFGNAARKTILDNGTHAINSTGASYFTDGISGTINFFDGIYDFSVGGAIGSYFSNSAGFSAELGTASWAGYFGDGTRTVYLADGTFAIKTSGTGYFENPDQNADSIQFHNALAVGLANIGFYQFTTGEGNMYQSTGAGELHFRIDGPNRYFSFLTDYAADVYVGVNCVPSGSYACEVNGTVYAEQLTSTDDITMAGKLLDTLAADDMEAFNVEGTTNPNTTPSTHNIFTIARTYNSNSTSVMSPTGMKFTLTNTSILSGTSGSSPGTVGMNVIMTTSGAHTIAPAKSPPSEGNTAFACNITRSGTLAWKSGGTVAVTGLSLTGSIQNNMNIAAGTMTSTVYGFVANLTNSCPAETAGTHTTQAYGFNVTVTGTQAPTGTSTGWGGYLKASGSDNNFGLQINVPASVGNLYGIWLDTDNGTGGGAIWFGAAKDAYIGFDGDSLNIVANAVTAGDALEVTANHFHWIVPADTDNVHNYFGTTNSGILTWMEDEDYFQFSDDIYMVGGENIVLSATTGTKLGTATTEKLAFHNSTPVVQRAGAAQALVSTTGSTQVTPYGYTTAAQADGIITLLNEIQAVLVEKGLMKGSA